MDQRARRLPFRRHLIPAALAAAIVAPLAGCGATASPSAPNDAAGSSRPSPITSAASLSPSPAGSRPAGYPSAGSAGDSPPGSATPLTSAAASPSGAPSAWLVGAGDIASCGLDSDSATARLVAILPGTVFTAGDDAYETGSAADFAHCYDPTWGAFKSRTRPALGNHDRSTANGAPYFAYFGTAAGTAPDGWYSFDLGGWHIVVLDSDCGAAGGCGTGSRQLAWLRADLAAHPVACTLAIWHHPRFSSGQHGDDGEVGPFWEALAAAGADVVVNGHDHDYERFAPQDPAGRLDPLRGIREFVVGTGGASLREFASVQPNSEVRDASTHGVIQLGLYPGGYSWRFVGVAGSTFSDSGAAACH